MANGRPARSWAPSAARWSAARSNEGESSAADALVASWCVDTIIHCDYPLEPTGRTAMYSQQELDDAVAAGALTPESADAFRKYVEGQRTIAIPDEEQFRLITGFNDIFVSIAAAILLVAVGWIGQWAGQRSGLAV